ncbi:30S ribosomal protein S6 [bacterium (Candidatus Howlettbacteria) CG_4_10_14_0_8_um_filter_40_9]|nr:MAG: 30S ribosomal protein S6 [bacterium (Candidatus Howlettbacteria) CG_4_10_14_0_8_um_filter_40_9]
MSEEGEFFMKKYELVYIIHPDLENTTDKVTEKVAGFIKKKSGVIISQDNWGKRKLAYDIKKVDIGIYVAVVFEAEAKDVREIEKNIILSEEIIRHLLVLHEEGYISKRNEEKASEEKTGKKPAVKEEEKLDLDLEEKKEEAKAEEKPEKAEKERLKELDEKLEELLGKDE